MENRGSITRLSDIDWPAWVPQERATLLFVIRDGHVLCIRKKRGLGAGKINGTGGRIDPGETPEQAAVREVEEELGITPVDVEPRGAIDFQFVDGYSIRVYIFTAPDYHGKPEETSEAIPVWASIENMPYDEMWVDDRLWLPILFAGQNVGGRAIFDGDTLLDCEFWANPA
ncbi:8-oxo-dGTP diphosphatase [Candidatus Entotheonella palauensis]|nr:8-oxo-dGTP diphosphatase [Candidatus Entotheonella palauensis]